MNDRRVLYGIDCWNRWYKEKQNEMYVNLMKAYLVPNPNSAVGALGLGCNHQWKQYQEFKESFEYCTVCDEKKGRS